MRYHVLKAPANETAEELETRIQAEANRGWIFEAVVRDDDGSHLIFIFKKPS